METRELIEARPEVVLVTTGYGMRRWFEVADAAGLGAELTAVLERGADLRPWPEGRTAPYGPPGWWTRRSASWTPPPPWSTP